MNSQETLVSIDFGSEYVRVAETRYDPEQPHLLNPQIVEFSGRSSLRNILLLTPDLSAAEEIGDDVFGSDLAYDAPELVRRSLSLANDLQSELGQATGYLLRHIYSVLELDRLADGERASCRTLLSIPINSQPGTGPRWEEALARVGFPSPKAFDSARSIVASYRQGHDLSGFYLLVDCGATYTRVALCYVSTEGVSVKATKSGRPGGRDFDEALVEHFTQRLADSTILSSSSRLELAYFVEEFKKQFSHEWARGSDSYDALYPVPSAQAVLSLGRGEFESTALAGELLSSFRTTARRILDSRDIDPTELDGVLLAGGGAHWPFAKAWARQIVGSERVYLSEYPEEAIVRGLPHLAVAQTSVFSTLPDEEAASKPEPAPEPAPEPGPVEPVSVSPTRAFWIELIGGLFGFMGLGWFFVLQSLPIGCLGLLGWWAILGVVLVGSGIFSVAVFNPLPLLIVLAVWLSGPLLSASLARHVAKQRSTTIGGI